MKRMLLIVGELELEGSVMVLDLRWECAPRGLNVFRALCMSAHDYKTTVGVDLGATSEF